MTQKYDATTTPVTIIGAGLVGLCTALELQDRGRQVELLDRLPPAEATSYGNAGMLCTWSVIPEATPGIWKKAPSWLLDSEGPLFVRPRYVVSMIPWLLRFLKFSFQDNTGLDRTADAMAEINQPVVDLYRQLLAGTGHEDLVRDSDYLFLYRNPELLQPDNIEVRLRRDRGADIDFLEQNELQALVPALSSQYRRAMRLAGQGYTINPGRLGKVLAERVLRQGGAILREDVRSIRRDDNLFEITTSHGTRKVQQVVIAAGAWSHRLSSQLDVKIPLEAERGYHVMFPTPDIDVPMPMSDAERHFGIVPMEMGLRVAGTAEFAGVDAPPDYRRAKVLTRLAREAFPDLNTDGEDYWMGPRPSFPDTVPVISALPGQSNAWIACGHGHLGVTGAPMTGRLIAAMVEGDRPDIDLTPYRADRF